MDWQIFRNVFIEPKTGKKFSIDGVGGYTWPGHSKTRVDICSLPEIRSWSKKWYFIGLTQKWTFWDKIQIKNTRSTQNPKKSKVPPNRMCRSQHPESPVNLIRVKLSMVVPFLACWFLNFNQNYLVFWPLTTILATRRDFIKASKI